jgi:hypothetical protein
LAWAMKAFLPGSGAVVEYNNDDELRHGGRK